MQEVSQRVLSNILLLEAKIGEAGTSEPFLQREVLEDLLYFYYFHSAKAIEHEGNRFGFILQRNVLIISSCFRFIFSDIKRYVSTKMDLIL